jgi:hypothetical protein
MSSHHQKTEKNPQSAGHRLEMSLSTAGAKMKSVVRRVTRLQLAQLDMVRRKPMAQKASRHPSALMNGHGHETSFLPQELLVICNESIQKAVHCRQNRGRNRAVFAQMFKQLLQRKRIAAEMVSPLPPFKKRVRLPFI